MDKTMIAMCGAYCGECEWKERSGCPGCLKSEGNMFWGDCAIAKCCIEKKHGHCGECEGVPCGRLRDAFKNPEHGDNGERLLNLRGWAQGEDGYRKLTRRK
jgi:hypothetical protein